jgi:HD-GYP domain-containing protein (c-di-GMP phosphodiesterase class II)
MNYKGITKRTLMKQLEDLYGILEKMKNSDVPYEQLFEAARLIADAVETRDPCKMGHQLRVADLARAIAEEMNLPPDRIHGVHMAGIIHDIGTISIPVSLINKPTNYTEKEFQKMVKHAESGHDLLKDIAFPWPIARIIIEHHERMNGSGYPRGLPGDQLLMESRILAVADVVDALSSDRPHRPALGIDAALYDIAGNRGVLFDPDAVDACIRLFREKRYKMIED